MNTKRHSWPTLTDGTFSSFPPMFRVTLYIDATIIVGMSRRFLSHTQFADLPGGGSRRFSDSTQGPAAGYYVSRDPGKPVEEGGSEEYFGEMHSPEMVEKAVIEHWDRNRDKALSATPVEQRDEVYQGKWSPPDQSEVYLDISDRTDSPIVAGIKAVKNRQQAIYDAGRDADIHVWNKDRTSYQTTEINEAIVREEKRKGTYSPRFKTQLL